MGVALKGSVIRKMSLYKETVRWPKVLVILVVLFGLILTSRSVLNAFRYMLY